MGEETQKGRRVVKKKNKRHTSYYHLGKFYQVRLPASAPSSSFTVQTKN
jgi:hypothetical protein